MVQLPFFTLVFKILVEAVLTAYISDENMDVLPEKCYFHNKININILTCILN